MDFLKNWKSSPWPMNSFKLPQYQTHRGYWIDGLPENSLAAFKKAREMGSQMIELDVHLGADNSLIVFHDATITIDGSKKNISELTHKEILKVVAAPSLDEVLGCPDIPPFLNIEVKSNSAWNLQTTLQLTKRIYRYKAENRVLVSSFNPFFLLMLRRFAPEIPVALLVSQETHPENRIYLKQMWAAPLLRPHILHLDHHDVTEELIADFCRRQIPVAVWTVNDQELGKRLLNAGAVSIISDKLIF